MLLVSHTAAVLYWPRQVSLLSILASDTACDTDHVSWESHVLAGILWPSSAYRSVGIREHSITMSLGDDERNLVDLGRRCEVEYEVLNYSADHWRETVAYSTMCQQSYSDL